MAIIDGKQISLDIKDEVREEVKALNEQGIYPGLAVVLVGENPASQVYVRNKKRACEYTGIKSFSYELPDTTTEEELLELIDTLNKDDKVNGILVQLPVPKHIDENKVIKAISPAKDVDGFHVESVGALCTGLEGFVSCTPAGVIELLKRSNVQIAGKNAVVVGRSNIVGKPVSLLLLQENATVTICHSKTADLDSKLKEADIVIAAVGRANMIKGESLKPGAVVIDVGINRLEDGKLYGDVDFESAKDVASLITPVPGGVGPMTIAMLMKNCVISAKRANGLK